MRIPGIPGASDPSFRTRLETWMGLDSFVYKVVERLAQDGTALSPHAVKVTIQIARYVLSREEGLAGDALIADVHGRLRKARLLLQPGHVQQILRVYASLVAEIGIEEVLEHA